MWLTAQERRSLAVVGSMALAGLGVLLWQERRPPLTVAGVPAMPEAASWDARLRSARQIDVNTAGVAELERLPGVGPTLAQRIVDDRTLRGPFRTLGELARVRGLGPKTLDALAPYLTTE